MSKKECSFGARRYPNAGNAIADGENFLEKALGVGRKARQLSITTIGKDAKVFIDGKLRVPESSYGTEYGKVDNYFYRHVSTYTSSTVGAIESAIVIGDNVQFFAEISI